ncbi:MAG: hypothetical protein HQ509_05535 [Candidatus Marinimicrobia bacterium]|nr:hypothetical protein [Candidatus Neomarinimicrobiota bacterium]
MKTTPVCLFIICVLITGCGTRKAKSGNMSISQIPTVKNWTPVLSFKGIGEQKSKLIPIVSDSIRVECQFSGGPKDTFILYLVEHGKSILKDGGFPLVMERGNGQSKYSFSPKPGEYYLHILSQNSSWDLQLYEY